MSARCMHVYVCVLEHPPVLALGLGPAARLVWRFAFRVGLARFWHRLCVMLHALVIFLHLLRAVVLRCL